MSILDRMVLAVERVRDRLIRATSALEAAGIPYAVAGGNAVAAWVATIDANAVRNTADVDILLNRADLDAAEKALAKAGFIRYELNGIEMFLDGPDGGPRHAVHMLMAGEKVRADYDAAAPQVSESKRQGVCLVVDLEALVRMKLTSFRRKDQVHIQDMLDIGLIDASWVHRFPAPLASRLQLLIDTPEQ